MRDSVMNGPEPTATGPIARSRALVPVPTAAEHHAPGVDPRASAGFVTQLVACAEGIGAFRRRRLAAPGVALASYGAGRDAPSRFQRVL